MARSKTTVLMHHPGANRYYEAPPTAVAFWEARGWKRDGVKETPAAAPKAVKATEKKES